MDNKNLFKFSILFLVLITSCQQNDFQSTKYSSIQAKTQSAMISEETDTPIMPIITKSMTLSTENTSTPFTTAIPTLNAIEFEEKILILMRNNGNCVSPCFWGLKPGLSMQDEAVTSIFALSNSMKYKMYIYSNSIETTYGQDFALSKKITIGLGFWEKDGKISKVNATISNLFYKEVDNNDWLAFRPDQVLRTYGVPEKIYIFLVSSPVAYSCYFIFLYDQFIIEYVGPDVVPSKNAQLCLLVDHAISRVDIWIGKGLANPPIVKEEWSLEKISNLTRQDFYNLLINDPSKACFFANLAR